MKAFVATPSLVRFILRRDRVRLAIWVGSLVGVTYFSAAAVSSTYDTPAEIASYNANIGSSPASIAFGGPPVGLDTIGGILVFETSLTVLLGVALMAMFTVVRHTRTEEELGRTELLASTVVGRHAGAAAAVVVATGASVLVGLGVTASMLAEQMDSRSAVVYGAAVAAMGLVFAALAGVTSQLMSHGRASIGVGLALLGLAFILRAVGDVQENFLSWLSPMGWSQQVRVTEANRWWPLGLSFGLALVLLAVTAYLAASRDMGSGIVPDRPGRAAATRLLSSPIGLAWRLQRWTVLAWAVGLFAMGLTFGSVSQELENMVKDNPTLAEYFESAGGNITDAFFATALLLMGIGAAGFAVSSALRLHAEEAADRLEEVLATGVSRHRAMLEPLAVTVLGAFVVVLAGGVGVGLSYAFTGGGTTESMRLALDSLVHLPAVLVLVGIATALTGWLPRLTAVAWGVLALTFLVGWLGNLLDLPPFVEGLSPFDHVPAVPLEQVRLGPVIALSAVAVGLVALGTIGFRRRDLV